MPRQQLGEMFKFSKPAEQRIAKCSDAQLKKLVTKNWNKWSSTEKKAVSNAVPLDELPPLLRTAKAEEEVKLFRKLEGAEGLLQKDDVIPGITTATLQCGEAGTFRGFQCLGYGFPTINFLVRGARFW